MIKLIKIFLPNNKIRLNFLINVIFSIFVLNRLLIADGFLKLPWNSIWFPMSLAGINFPLVAFLHSALLCWIYYIIIIIVLNSQFYSLQFDEFQLLNAANLFNLWATQHNSKATEPTQPFINPPSRSALQIRASLVVLCCLFCRFISHPFPAPAPIYIQPRRRRRRRPLNWLLWTANKQ